jgi:hypothetical protein
MKALSHQFEHMETHGSLATSVALWFAMLSPLLGLIIPFFGAWLVRLLNG